MGWPYRLLSLNSEQKQLRRETINWYAAIAHLSSFLFPLIIFAVRLATTRLLRILSGTSGGVASTTHAAVPTHEHDGDDDSETDEYGQYHADIPGSPGAKADRGTLPGALTARWRRFVWIMGEDVWVSGMHFGQKDQWLLGGVWMAWLLALCFVGTGQGKQASKHTTPSFHL
jgi:hypothetical protein